MNETIYDNRYRLVEFLGSGTTANVYRALDLETNREVALKIFDEQYLSDQDALKLFEREIKAVARLEKHVGLLSYYGGSMRDGYRYLVMDIAKGETLMHYLNRVGGKLPINEAVSYLSQLLSVLSYIHSRGVIHRDIKPQNIRISRDGSLKLCDFGIAAVIGAESFANGKAIGTVNYISPEQAKGIEVSPQSDIYSAGVVFYEMLTGVLPFTSDKSTPEDRIGDIIRKHLKEIPIRPSQYNPNIPDALVQIIMRAMLKNPSSRFSSAEDMLRYLTLYTKNPTVLFDFDLPNEEFDSGAALPKYTAAESFRPKTRVKEKVAKQTFTKDKKQLTRGKLLFLSLILLLSVIAAGVIYSVVHSLFFYEYGVRTVLTKGGLLYEPYTDAMRDRLESDGYEVTLEYRYSSIYPSGTVIAQDPPPQSVQEIPENASPKLRLTVSTAKASLLMPDYIGKDYRAARAELEDKGFTVLVNRINSNKKYGSILATSPASDEMVNLGDTVQLTISIGEKTRYQYMPNLVGMPISQAKSELSSLGIAHTVFYEDSDLPIGTVIYQSRPYGEKLAIDYFDVQIHVSNGTLIEEILPPEESDDPVTDDGLVE